MDQSHAGLGAHTTLHNLGPRGTTAVLLWTLLTLVYLYVRIPLWNPDAPTLSTLLLAAELFGIGSLALHIFSSWTLVDRRAPPPALDAKADIFITTWNEPVEMLRNTLLAAKAVRHAGTIWLLDDGVREDMRQLADELGIAYLSRTDRSHAKAGNLNNALKHSTADYVAVFDCDHAPSPDFFERTLGYFNDPQLAFVQTPQDFYNIDSFQHRGSRDHNEVWHEQTLFYRVIQPGKDRWNAAFFCGSCAVVRRSALDDIGGFATGTITEDLHTSLKMHKRGWLSAYHAEALAFGLSPSDFDQYQTQRLRWARGAMQVWTKEGFLFSKQLSVAQRLSYLASTSTYFEGWQKAIVYFMPIVVILTGWLPIAWSGPGFLLLFSAWLLSGMAVNEIVSRGYAKTLWMEEYNFFRYFTFIRATFALVLPTNRRFVVTPKGRASSNSLLGKLLPQAILGAGAAIALVVGTWLFVTRGHLPAGAFAVTVVFLAFDLILTAKALNFAKRLRQRRGSHRFPIPVPVTIGQGESQSLTLAEDISSEGMKVSAVAVSGGDGVEGTLHLPNGDLPFRASTVRRFADGMIAVMFNWTAPGDADPLNACLYGNTLQWDINSWSETKSSSLLDRNANDGSRQSGAWELGKLITDSEQPITCVVRQEQGNDSTWRAVSYRRPQTQDGIVIATAAGSTNPVQVAFSHSVGVGGGQVYVSGLAADSTLAWSGSHRHPRWARDGGEQRAVSWQAAAAAE